MDFTRRIISKVERNTSSAISTAILAELVVFPTPPFPPKITKRCFGAVRSLHSFLISCLLVQCWCRTTGNVKFRFRLKKLLETSVEEAQYTLRPPLSCVCLMQYILGNNIVPGGSGGFSLTFA